MRGTRRTTGPLLISEAYVHDLDQNQAATYFRITNPESAVVNLTGWSLVVDGKPLQFPGGAGIGPGRDFYVARDAVAFQRLMGRWPQWQYGGSTTRAARLQAPSGLPDISPWAGSAVLLDPEGHPVDALAWGSLVVGLPGWEGAPLASVPAGEVYARIRDNQTGQPVDLGNRHDWKQGDRWLPLRSFRVGQSDFPAPTFSVRGQVTASVAPDCSYAAVVSLLAGARRSIDLNLYQMTSVPLCEQLLAAQARGLTVRVFLDGTPFGRILEKTRYLAQQLADHGVAVRWMIHDHRQGVGKRYRFNHAKYAVIDGATVLVWSENWSAHSFPAESAGGNRGWGLFVECRSLARYFTKVFEADWDPGRPDSIPFLPGHPYWGGLDKDPDGNRREPGYGYRRQFQPLTLAGHCRITPLLAPDHALVETGGIIGLLRRATTSVEIQTQYIPVHWGLPEHGSPEETPNLYLQEAVAAARRGVHVRVMMGQRDPEPWSPQDSIHTYHYLNTLAGREKLALEARFDDPKGVGLNIHNKGVIVDRHYTVITSVNWSENAPGHNREAGLIVESPEIGTYFGQVFDWDWEHGRR